MKKGEEFLDIFRKKIILITFLDNSFYCSNRYKAWCIFINQRRLSWGNKLRWYLFSSYAGETFKFIPRLTNFAFVYGWALRTFLWARLAVRTIPVLASSANTIWSWKTLRTNALLIHTKPSFIAVIFTSILLATKITDVGTLQLPRIAFKLDNHLIFMAVKSISPYSYLNHLFSININDALLLVTLYILQRLQRLRKCFISWSKITLKSHGIPIKYWSCLSHL